jgi:hypothetical protein
MSRRARIVLVVALFLGFFVTAPLLLLYTSGYSYSPAKRRIEKTGSLSIESVPRGAEVRINGVPRDQNTPLIVSRLLPETYSIEILAKGYIPWKKRLAVESGRTTFAKSISLLPDTLPHLTVAAAPSEAAWTTDGTRVAYAVAADAWLEIIAHDVPTGGSTVLDRFPSGTYAKVALSWSPDGGTVAATLASSNGGVSLYFYDTDGATPPIAVHDAVKGIAFDVPVWDDERRAIFLAADGAFMTDIPTRTTSPFIAASDLVDIAVRNDTIWTIRTSPEGAILEHRGKNDAAAETALALERPYTFVDTGNDALLLTEARKGSGMFVDQATGALSQASEYTVSARSPVDGRTLLLCGRFELAVFTPGVDPTPNALTRIGEPIDSCTWHPSGQYALYSVGGRIIAIELDERDARNTYVIADFDEVDALSVDQKAEVLRFTGSVGNQKGIFERPL